MDVKVTNFIRVKVSTLYNTIYRVSHRVWYIFKPVVDPQVKFLQKNFQCPKFDHVGTRSV
jgi:hypothetical protein